MVSKTSILLFLIHCCFTSIQYVYPSSIRQIKIPDIPNIIKQKCVLLAVPPIEKSLFDLMKNLSEIFSLESRVAIGIVNKVGASVTFTENTDMRSEIKWSRSDKDSNQKRDLAFFHLKKEDRSCLILPIKTVPMAQVVQVRRTLEDLTHFLNIECGTFRDNDGNLTEAGKKRYNILKRLYKVPIRHDARKSKYANYNPLSILTQCEKTAMPSKEEFINKYLFTSRPVIIKRGASHWMAMTKWSNDYLRDSYGHEEVHIKLTPEGEFEGCDKAEKFDNFAHFKIPDTVKAKLNFPDLVVVRPATLNIPFSKFLDIIETHMNVSAYLEYSSIPQYFPELEKDLEELEIVKDVLKRVHLNIWLSNGNTLGNCILTLMIIFLSS